MKKAALILGSLALFAAATAQAADPAKLAKADHEFMEKAAGGGMFEVEAGKLAESKGQDPQVKAFGGMLVKDHSAANDELKALAASKSVTLPAAVPAPMQKKLDKLSKSKHFDQDFIKEVGLEDHKKDIGLFEKTSKGAKDADVKAFASKTLPTLKQHRQHAEELSKGMKGKHKS
jgi:putative membrane protein